MEDESANEKLGEIVPRGSQAIAGSIASLMRRSLRCLSESDAARNRISFEAEHPIPAKESHQGAEEFEASHPEPFKFSDTASSRIRDTLFSTIIETEKLPYANDASFEAIMSEFVQLSYFKIGMFDALNDGPYMIPDTDTMKAVVADAYMLYDIINLNESPAALLNLVAQGYGEEIVRIIVADILLYAKKKGVTLEDFSDLSKPEDKRIFDLAKGISEQKGSESWEETAKQERKGSTEREKDFKPTPTRSEIEKLSYANDATFKAIMGEFERLVQFKNGLCEELNSVESLGNYLIEDADTMKAVVADAYMLYAILELKESPATLFDLLVKKFGEVRINHVIAEILLYAKEKGITAEMHSGSFEAKEPSPSE